MHSFRSVLFSAVLALAAAAPVTSAATKSSAPAKSDAASKTMRVTTTSIPPLVSSKIDAAAWRADLDLLARELPARHPDAFYRMTRAAWDSAVAATRQRLAAATREQAIVALMELVALVNDGHTAISPAFDPALKLRNYPIELCVFEDGLYVKSAAPALASVTGAKVVRIGDVSVDEALKRAGRTVPAENDFWRATWAAGRLEIPEIVNGLGLAKNAERLSLEIERDGKRRTVEIQPSGAITPRGHDPRGSIDRSGWVSMERAADASATPLWRRAQDTPYHVEWDARDSVLFAGYRGVVDMNGSNVAFWRRVFAMADSLPVRRFVLDLRENGGGNSFYNRQVVRGIVKRPALDRPGGLFVVIGPRTFSAAMNLALDLEKWTNATFVGEPTGNATMFFGDHQPVKLPNSGITVNVSSLPWHPYDARDRRDFVAPSMYVPMTAKAFAENRDPVMDAILARGSEPPFTARIEAAAERGDSAAVVRTIEEARGATANRYRRIDADVNTLGYALLNSHRIEPAITVFRANARVHPNSANAWDSLGEALAMAGRKDEAIASYRRAVAIDPEQQSARQALARLGAN